MHTLENDQLCVTISDHGAELSGIFDKKNDREILWNADPSHWKRHAPVLFPNVGRYYEDHCLINGKLTLPDSMDLPGIWNSSAWRKTENSVNTILLGNPTD